MDHQCGGGHVILRGTIANRTAYYIVKNRKIYMYLCVPVDPMYYGLP